MCRRHPHISGANQVNRTPPVARREVEGRGSNCTHCHLQFVLALKDLGDDSLRYGNDATYAPRELGCSHPNVRASTKSSVKDLGDDTPRYGKDATSARRELECSRPNVRASTTSSCIPDILWGVVVAYAQKGPGCWRPNVMTVAGNTPNGRAVASDRNRHPTSASDLVCHKIYCLLVQPHL